MTANIMRLVIECLLALLCVCFFPRALISYDLLVSLSSAISIQRSSGNRMYQVEIKVSHCYTRLSNHLLPL